MKSSSRVSILPLQVLSLSDSKTIFLDVEISLVWGFSQFAGLVGYI